MINTNQNLLFIATILTLCIISFVHVFLFPLYNVDTKHGLSKTFLEFEQRLCTTNYKHRKHRKRVQCPQYGIVTVIQGGRVGNQMWEYASVWAVSRRTGLEPYVPRCIRSKLDQIFESLSVPTFQEISHCPVDYTRFVKNLDAWNYTNQSILLPKYSALIEMVLSWVQDIRQEYTLQKKLFEKSQNILHVASKNQSTTFVSVHVRRTDYIGYLWRKHGANPANITYYVSAMKYFEEKYKNVTFIVVSDDIAWCKQHFPQKPNIYLTKKSILHTPALDFALLASTNHSIFDYGTFGVWGALLAGGEVIYYNITSHITAEIARLMNNWHTI